MRIRRSASRLVGSAYSASAAPAPTFDAAPRFDLPPLPPPPPHLAPCITPESSSGPGFSGPSASSTEPCELSRSPWDLIADLSLSDEKEEDELMDKYFVHVKARASWLFSAPMPPAASTNKKLPTTAYGDSSSTQLRREVVKRAAMEKKKEGKPKKKAKVMKEAGQDGAARVWMCKKNDGRRWRCNRSVSQPNTLCEYHFVQKHSYLNPNFEFHSMAELEETAPAPTPATVQAAASKPSTINKPQKKKKPGNDYSATEGFYYYAGFRPFRSKRQYRRGGMNEPLPPKQEEEETPEDASHPTQEASEVAEFTNQAACQDVSRCDNDDIAGITGVEEESSDDDYNGIGITGCNKDGTVDPQASIGKGKAPWKQWRKPVKARSLKSLM